MPFMSPDEENKHQARLYRDRTVGPFYITYRFLTGREAQVVARYNLQPVFYSRLSPDINTDWYADNAANLTEADIYAGLLTGELTTTEIET